MASYDYIIVGGGIVGLSAAWAILERFTEARVAVLEKETDWAQHQTGRNSGVIHSGIYYKPGSLKARLCLEGNRRLVEFCELHAIPYDICGKVIVATEKAELPGLQRLCDRGLANGLVVQKLDGAEVKEFEPHVSCLEGLRVPSTGIVSYTEICRKLAELIKSRGGDLHLAAEVRSIDTRSKEVVLGANRGEFVSSWVINCAGLHSDRIAKLAGAEPQARIVPFRGEYYELAPEKRYLVRDLIYPVPDPQFPFLGVHFTRMIDGSVHAGPNAVLSFKREGYHRSSFNARDFLDTVTYGGFWRLAARHPRAGLAEMYRSFSKPAFVRSLQRLIPAVNSDDLLPSKAGVRAQALQPDGGLVDDFLIVEGVRTTHVCNAPSPAATASLEIGREIANRVPDIRTAVKA